MATSNRDRYWDPDANGGRGGWVGRAQAPAGSRSWDDAARGGRGDWGPPSKRQKGLGFKQSGNRQNIDAAYQAGRSGASKPPSDDAESMEAYRAGRREYMRKQNLDPAKKAVNNRGRPMAGPPGAKYPRHWSQTSKS